MIIDIFRGKNAKPGDARTVDQQVLKAQPGWTIDQSALNS